MMLNAGAYLPVDGEMIPTGVVKPVDGTPFDFRQARPLRMETEGEQLPYDQNFCLASTRGPLKQASWAQGATSGVEMEVWTTEPGLQLYTGQYVTPRKGLDGRALQGVFRLLPGAAGLAGCAEPALFPAGDAVAGRRSTIR